MSDLIDRQAAIDAICEDGTRLERDGCLTLTMVERKQRDVDILKTLPSAQPGWISVTERLPEYGTTVLTCNHDGEYEINHIIDEEDEEWFWDGAVAWMPLPKPWEGGQE